MKRQYRLTKGNSEDIAFATTSLAMRVLTFSEFKKWLYFVIERSDEVPNYFFDILDLEESFDYTLKVADYLGFWAAWDASDGELEALRGVGFKRFSNFRSDASHRNSALAALEANPRVEEKFRETFPFIEF